MSVLLGRSNRGRSELVQQGSGLALRDGRWKYIEPSNRPKMNTETNTELGNDTAPQLYDLASDPSDQRNVAAAQPARVKAMAARLEALTK